MKSGPLSDPNVVTTLNRDFIPVIVDPSNPGTAGLAPGIRLWEQCYESNWAFRLGYATTVLVSYDARVPLAASGIAKHHWRDVVDSANHVPERLVGLLGDATARHARYRAIQDAPADSEKAREDLAALQREIIRAIQETSRGADGRTATIDTGRGT